MPIKFPCPYPPGGLCPPECITSDGPLCDFDDDCPYASRRKINEIARNVISDKCMPGMEDDSIIKYLKELSDNDTISDVIMDPQKTTHINPVQVESRMNYELLKKGDDENEDQQLGV